MGWLLVAATSGASAFFTMLYGLHYGRASSLKWLISMAVSFVESVFVTQPLKVRIPMSLPSSSLAYTFLPASCPILRLQGLLHLFIQQTRMENPPLGGPRQKGNNQDNPSSLTITLRGGSPPHFIDEKT